MARGIHSPPRLRNNGKDERGLQPRLKRVWGIISNRHSPYCPFPVRGRLRSVRLIARFGWLGASKDMLFVGARPRRPYRV